MLGSWGASRCADKPNNLRILMDLVPLVILKPIGTHGSMRAGKHAWKSNGWLGLPKHAGHKERPMGKGSRKDRKTTAGQITGSRAKFSDASLKFLAAILKSVLVRCTYSTHDRKCCWKLYGPQFYWFLAAVPAAREPTAPQAQVH